MLTKEIIETVPRDDCWRLMVEPKFYVYGKLFQLYSDNEMKRQELPIIHKAIIESDYGDSINPESASIPRTVCDLVTAIQSNSDFNFELVRPYDCRLILAIIDKFLKACLELTHLRALPLSRTHLLDYHAISKLALAMHDMSEELEARDELNTREKENAGKVSFFDIRLTNIADDESVRSTRESRWVNPFQSFIDTRLGEAYSSETSIY